MADLSGCVVNIRMHWIACRRLQTGVGLFFIEPSRRPYFAMVLFGNRIGHKT